MTPNEGATIGIRVSDENRGIINSIRNSLTRIFPRPFRRSARRTNNRIRINQIIGRVRKTNTMRFRNHYRATNLQLQLLRGLLMRILRRKQLTIPSPRNRVPMGRPRATIGRNFLGKLRTILTTRRRLTRKRRGIHFRKGQTFIVIRIGLSIREISVTKEAKDSLSRLPTRPPRRQHVFTRKVSGRGPVL